MNCPPTDSSLPPYELPSPTGIYRCRATVRDTSSLLTMERVCGEPIQRRTRPVGSLRDGHGFPVTGEYWAHVDPALDRDHAAIRPRPLRGAQQPRAGLLGWLDSKRHRAAIANLVLLVAVVGGSVFIFGLVSTLYVALTLSAIGVVGILTDRWVKRAPRP